MAIEQNREDDSQTFPIELTRIEVIWPMIFIGSAAILSYGWTLQVNSSIFAPLVLQSIIGGMLTGVLNVISTLLVDLYPDSPATATASNNLVRCSLGAGATAVIQKMISKLGNGWCFTLVGLICLASSPLLLVLLKWGPAWRAERAVKKSGSNSVSK